MTEKMERDILFFIFGVFLGCSFVFLSIAGYMPTFGGYAFWNILVVLLIFMSIFLKKSRFLWIGLLLGIIAVFGLFFFGLANANVLIEHIFLTF